MLADNPNVQFLTFQIKKIVYLTFGIKYTIRIICTNTWKHLEALLNSFYCIIEFNCHNSITIPINLQFKPVRGRVYLSVHLFYNLHNIHLKNSDLFSSCQQAFFY